VLFVLHGGIEQEYIWRVEELLFQVVVHEDDGNMIIQYMQLHDVFYRLHWLDSYASDMYYNFRDFVWLQGIWQPLVLVTPTYVGQLKFGLDLFLEKEIGGLLGLKWFAVSSGNMALKMLKEDRCLLNCFIVKHTCFSTAVSIPELDDADNGYTNCMNVRRTMKGISNAGFVLKSMVTTKESYSTKKFSAWMLLTGTFSDDESYNLVVGLLIGQKLDDSPLEYWDMMMKSGYTPSPSVFTVYNQACVSSGRWDTLTSIIDKFKTSDKIKVWCPQWAWCIDIAEVAFAANISKLVLCALEFLARWIAHGENVKPPIQLSVNEGLVISPLSIVEVPACCRASSGIGAGVGLVTDGLGAISSGNFAIRIWDPGGHVKNSLGTSCISSGGECQPPPHKVSRRPSNEGGAVGNVSNKQSSDEKGTC
jgi:hypothetical protein